MNKRRQEADIETNNSLISIEIVKEKLKIIQYSQNDFKNKSLKYGEEYLLNYQDKSFDYDNKQ